MKIKIPLQVIELEKGNYHLIVTGKFLDENIGCWALDTGASKTVFDKNLEQYYVLEENCEDVQSVGIGEGLMLSRYAVMRPFILGKYKIENQKVALFDLTHINEFYRRTITRTSICGLIGSDVLLKYKAVINYKYKTLTLAY
ncbi:MAG: hypothetical protein LBV47_03460 [Bacteroidales bacterium]|jgi:hypothetical protein|nr:hypothetical protein [Bacteroidales bacterium]